MYSMSFRHEMDLCNYVFGPGILAFKRLWARGLLWYSHQGVVRPVAVCCVILRIIESLVVCVFGWEVIRGVADVCLEV